MRDTFGDDLGGVCVVDQYRLWCKPVHLSGHSLDHGKCAHGEEKATWTDGFLADNPVPERDRLILVSRLKSTLAEGGEDVIRVGDGCSALCGAREP